MRDENRNRLPGDELLVIADEVYKYVCHGSQQHIHFASLPDMDDITLTVSSAGKTFSVQQAGRSAGSSDRDISYSPAKRLLPYLQFCAPTPMQQLWPTA